MNRQSIPPEWATLAAKAAGFDQMKVELEAIYKVCRTQYLGVGSQYFRTIEDMAKQGIDRANQIGGQS